jgi:hypothetical protein
MRVHRLLHPLGVDDEDTIRIDLGSADTDRGLVAVLVHDDTDEWEDTDREVEAQGTLDQSIEMFEDTGVVIVDRPPATPVPQVSDDFSVTFHRAQSPRAGTEPAWPPEPREPAIRAPQIRERAFKRARVYRVVNVLTDTKNEKKN